MYGTLKLGPPDLLKTSKAADDRSQTELLSTTWCSSRRNSSTFSSLPSPLSPQEVTPHAVMEKKQIAEMSCSFFFIHLLYLVHSYRGKVYNDVRSDDDSTDDKRGNPQVESFPTQPSGAIIVLVGIALLGLWDNYGHYRTCSHCVCNVLWANVLWGKD